MDRVQIAAIAVAVLIIGYWFATMPAPRERAADAPAPPGTAEPAQRPEDVAPPSAPGATPLSARAPATPSPEVDLTRTTGVTLENDAMQLELSPLGGRLRSVRLKRYADRLGARAEPVELVTTPERGTLLVFLGPGPLEGLESLEHRVVRRGPREVELRADRAGITVTRTLTLDEVGYGARLRLRVENRSSSAVRASFQLAWYGQARPTDAPNRFQNYGLAVVSEGGLSRTLMSSSRPLACTAGGRINEKVIPSPVDWVGVESQYFMLAALADDAQNASGYQGSIGHRAAQSVLRYAPVEIPAGLHVEENYRLYLGPKLIDQVEAVDARLLAGVRSGWTWVRPLVDLFVAMLVWTHEHVIPNYGVAIILLTLAVRLATWPLTQRSMKSMRSLGVIAPEMRELQAKYKDDRARQQQEVMSLYKRKGINPLSAMGGGCLPMLIQMPFLLALFFALQSSIELRHAPFVFWIQDLSAPEDLFAVFGVPIRVLPLLMGGSMLLQQRLMPSTASADPQQRKMMQFMSIIFIFLFYTFPSGLVLYWFVSNLLAIAQQLLVNRKPIVTKAQQ